MREQRKAERLADYYRRNFREYLNFDGGAAKNRVRTMQQDPPSIAYLEARRWLESQTQSGGSLCRVTDS